MPSRDHPFGSCSPLSPLLPGPREEQPPAKGLYYRRARRLGSPDASLVTDLQKELLVNVGGRRYLLPWSSLDGECSQKCHSIFVVETICVAWFSLEFCLRFVQAPNKCRFFRGPLNIIDILAISPYYVSLAVSDDEPREDSDRPGGGGSYLEKVGLVLRVLRALRILYVMRLARHSLGLQTLGLTVRRCAREFGLLLLFLCVAVTLFSPLVYLAENESGRVLEFTSIPASYWWAIISMTTVGYGDMVPCSVPGQMVALSSILSGILIMAFPATSIFHTFSHSYLELKKEQERAQARLRRLRAANTGSERELLQDTDDPLLAESPEPAKDL
ncbi:potassium voltage-gated channel subfamily G member 4 [Echinops telfairi]|uniref:Potassium voltage-gated channel subfamily G member 4 n=1 Tax=Echinops telfairi TaxID=9371 RepID=A0ABM0IPK4_ECHTE|nr:potassium voltage-gated channel subfamily G member 4 [Echinops telfairi]